MSKIRQNSSLKKKFFNHYFNILYWTKFRYWLFLLIFNAFWHLQPAHSDLCSHLYAIKMLQFTLELASTANFWVRVISGVPRCCFSKSSGDSAHFSYLSFFHQTNSKKVMGYWNQVAFDPQNTPIFPYPPTFWTKQ